MATIHIDGKPYEADPSRHLLEVCLELGFDLPYFCWHPALDSVGACRQCAVKQFKDENDEQGSIVMACMTPASDGTRISIDDPEAREFRASVIEWLMINHPHDCPICDEGGECHLQDMTVMTGHTYRRYRFNKRTYRNQDLGPLINHEMNRCIQCYRCVRFYDDHAGGKDLQAMAAHDHVYFGRHEDGTLESPFSGNLVEVCPTGVFTDKQLKSRYTRKWDLITAPSVCQHCGLGCNVTPGVRYGELRRVRARYNGAVNGYFICDRGRYGADHVDHERRLRQALAPRGADEPAERLDAEAALTRAADAVGDGRRAIGIGSPRASLEANYALRRLVGPDRFFHGVTDAEHRRAGRILEILRSGAVRAPSLREVEQADAVLVLGEDAWNTAPMLALALRQATRHAAFAMADAGGIPRWHDAAVRELAQETRSPLFVVSPSGSELDEVAARALRATPERTAALGWAIARRLGDGSGGAEEKGDEGGGLAAEVAEALAAAERPLVVSGTGCESRAVIDAAAAVAGALGRRRGAPVGLFYAVPEANSLGLALLEGAGGLDAALERLAQGDVDTAVVLENDLLRRVRGEQVDALRDGVSSLIVVDHVAHESGARADVVLPAAPFTEAAGTSVNNEGRAQRFEAVLAPEAPVQASWRWMRDLMRAGAGVEEPPAWERLDDVVEEIAQRVQGLERVRELGPRPDLRVTGARLPRALPRYSGRTAISAGLTVHEPKPPEDPDSPYSFSMEGAALQQRPALAPEFWAPGWNSIQALNRFQEEIEGTLGGGDPGVRVVQPEEGRGLPDDVFEARTASERPEEGALRIVPLWHVHGSDELSALAPGPAELAPAPYFALHPDDAGALGLAEATTVRLHVAGQDGDASPELPLRLVEGLAAGTVGVPRGLSPELNEAALRGWGRLERGGGA